MNTINEYLRDIQTLCDDEVSNEEMAEYLSEVSKTRKSLYYNNFGFWFIIIVSLVSTGFLYHLDRTIDPKYLIIGPIIAFVCGFVIYNRYNRLSSVSESLKELYEKNLLGVRKIPVKRNLKDMFCEFSRGNHSNKIIQASRSKDNGFDLVCYNWVNKYYVTEERTNKQGKSYSVERVEYESFYRDGIIFQTNIYDNIWIQTCPICFYGEKTWTTAYEQFNKKFTVKCDEEIAAAKVLIPSTVLQIYETSKVIDELNIELRDNGIGLISFPHNSLRTNIIISLDNLSNLSNQFRFSINKILSSILTITIGTNYEHQRSND